MMRKMTSLSGITLIELCITISILAIITVVAVPYFSTMKANFERHRALSLLNTQIHQLRHDALVYRSRFAICGSHDGLVCSNDGWNSGILVFTDNKQHDRNRQNNEEIKQYHRLDLEKGTLSWKGATGGNIVFQANTGLPSGSNGTFTYCSANTDSYQLVLSNMGNTRINKSESC